MKTLSPILRLEFRFSSAYVYSFFHEARKFVALEEYISMTMVPTD